MEGQVGFGLLQDLKKDAAILRRRVLEELVRYADETKALDREDVRQRIADVAIDVEAQKLLAYETIWKMTQGKFPTYEPSRDKVFNDYLAERISSLGMDLLGERAQLEPGHRTVKWCRSLAGVESSYWSFPGMNIAAGTIFTQKNIIGQFGLGLPRSY